MTATQSPPGLQHGPAPAAAAPRPGWPLHQIVALLASLKLTVVLLLLMGVLTFFGTLAQKDLGLFVVQRDYFESLFVVHDTGWGVLGLDVRLPLPGGYLLMTLLFLNLVVGGVVRHRWHVRNAGILVTHFGIALLLVAGFVKLNWSYAGHVALFEPGAGAEGDRSRALQTASMISFHDYELALVRQQGDRILERTIPEKELLPAVKRAVTVDDPGLPFTLAITRWYDNCQPQPKGPMFEAPTPVIADGKGPGVFLRPLARDPERERNQAGCYVTVTERETSKQQLGILWGADFRPFDDRRFPFTFTAGGATWGLDLRRVVWDLPFSVRLDKFQKTDHPGTLTPRDFSSWVTVRDGGDERQVHIYMNHPLRKDGYTFFQTSWGPQPDSPMRGPPWWSVFEVAKNPSDAWPKYASYVVLLGLLLHFVPKLFRYLNSSTRRASLPEMS